MTLFRKVKAATSFAERQLVKLAALCAIAALMFAGTTILTRSFQKHVSNVARSAFASAEADVRSGHLDEAIPQYRTALTYDRDNRAYAFRLATVLVEAHHNEESAAYLRNLWDREPGNAFLNLQLARVAARTGDQARARQYYRGAVYGTFETDPQRSRSEARREYAEYLLSIGDKEAADAELLASLPELPDDNGLRKSIAGLLFRAGDAERAGEVYRRVLRSDRTDTEAMEGLGRAAFATGNYREAARQFAATGKDDPALREMLEISRAVLALDPFQGRLGFRERVARTQAVYRITGQRLDSCEQAFPTEEPGAAGNVRREWKNLAPRVTLRAMRNEGGLTEGVMDLAFRVENAARQSCGEGTVQDKALLLIAKEREENQR